jgi:hypothetical protein
MLSAFDGAHHFSAPSVKRVAIAILTCMITRERRKMGGVRKARAAFFSDELFFFFAIKACHVRLGKGAYFQASTFTGEGGRKDGGREEMKTRDVLSPCP